MDTSQELSGSQHRSIDQYDALKKRLALADLGFWIACMVGPLWLGVVIAITLIVRPDEFRVDAISISVLILASILIIPIYRVRRDYQRRVKIVRMELEEPDSSFSVDSTRHDRTFPK